MQTGDRKGLHDAMGKVKSGVNVAPEVVEAWAALKAYVWLAQPFPPPAHSHSRRRSVDGYLVAVLDGNNVTLRATEVLPEPAAVWESTIAHLQDTEVAFGAVSMRVEGAPMTRFLFFTWVRAARLLKVRNGSTVIVTLLSSDWALCVSCSAWQGISSEECCV